MTNCFDFDRLIPRRGTGSLKWDKYPNGDILPMWLADMDFASPPCVVEALRRYVDRGVFGYPLRSGELTDVACAMVLRRYGWTIDPDWLVWLPSLVAGLELSCRAVGKPGDEVLSPVPIYAPFLLAPHHAGRTPVPVQTVIDANGRWGLPAADLEAAITERTALFMLCNPHNPVGRALTRDELQAYADICCRHNLIVCSDEIHCDLVLDDVRHIPIASLNPEIARRSITLMASSKTYNTAGLACAFAVIPDPALRHVFLDIMKGIVPEINAAGYVAALAAWRDGEPWLQALLAYLRNNRDYVEAFVAEHLAPIRMTHVEATYLAWLDVSGLPVEDPHALCEAYGVGLSDGRLFRGPGFLRLNFGCPRELLRDGLERIRQAVNSLQTL